MHPPAPARPLRHAAAQAIALVISLALVGLVAWVGSAATATSVGSWYPTLKKPSWTPPGTVIGAVWTVLYVAMAVAAWLVWRRGGLDANRVPLGLFGAQLAANAGWSIVFFRAQAPGWALLEIALLWGLVAATLIAFWRRSRLAGALLAPYLAWVSFAGALNATIWLLNRS